MQPLRLANSSGFPGERMSALSEVLNDGPVNVVTGDYLAEQPGDATAYGVYWPALVNAAEVAHTVVHADGRREVIPPLPFPPIMDKLPVPHAQPDRTNSMIGGDGGIVVVGPLEEGVAASTRFDPPAKGLGACLRSRPVDIPGTLLR